MSSRRVGTKSVMASSFAMRDLVRRSGRTLQDFFITSKDYEKCETLEFGGIQYLCSNLSVPAQATSLGTAIDMTVAMQLATILYYEPDVVVEAEDERVASLCGGAMPAGQAESSFWMEGVVQLAPDSPPRTSVGNGTYKRLVIWPYNIDTGIIQNVIANSPDCTSSVDAVLRQVVDYVGQIARYYGWILRLAPNYNGFPAVALGPGHYPEHLHDAGDPVVVDILHKEAPVVPLFNSKLQSVCAEPSKLVTFIVYDERQQITVLRETRRFRFEHGGFDTIYTNEADFLHRGIILSHSPPCDGILDPNVLGTGTSAVVYQATMRRFARDGSVVKTPVAVKVIFELSEFVNSDEIGDSSEFIHAKRAAAFSVGPRVYDAFWLQRDSHPPSGALEDDAGCEEASGGEAPVKELSVSTATGPVTDGVIVMDRLSGTLQSVFQTAASKFEEAWYANGRNATRAARVFDKANPKILDEQDADAIFNLLAALSERVGLVHCDAKPDNIGYMIVSDATQSIPSYVWVVIDFNLSSEIDDDPDSYGWSCMFPTRRAAEQMRHVWDVFILLRYIQLHSLPQLHPVIIERMQRFVHRLASRVHAAFSEIYPDFGRLFPYAPDRVAFDLTRFMRASGLLKTMEHDLDANTVIFQPYEELPMPTEPVSVSRKLVRKGRLVHDEEQVTAIALAEAHAAPNPS